MNLFFVLMISTIVCTTNNLFAMDKEKMTAPPKTQKRKKSNPQIFRFSDASSSNSNYESSSCSEEGNIDGQHLNAQSSDQPSHQASMIDKEPEKPNHNGDNDRLGLSNNEVIQKERSKKPPKFPLSKEELKSRSTMTIEQFYNYK